MLIKASFLPKFKGPLPEKNTLGKCGKALLFVLIDIHLKCTRICLRVHISPFSWINQNCIFKGQNPIKLSTWMIKELSIIPNYLRLFTFEVGTHIFTENQLCGKICIGLKNDSFTFDGNYFSESGVLWFIFLLHLLPTWL